MYIIKSGPPVSSFNEILPQIQSGLILVELVHFITNERVTGYYLNPKIEANCITNLQKVFEKLRNLSKFPVELARDYLIDFILAGDASVCIELIKEIKKYYEKSVHLAVYDEENEDLSKEMKKRRKTDRERRRKDRDIIR